MSAKSLSSTIVQNVLAAKVYDVIKETPLTRATKLSLEYKTNVYLKREDMLQVHSFKIRGAYNCIAQLSIEEKAKGIIAASAGNHAQGVALSAQKLGLSALIIMPVTTPSIKIDAVKHYGAIVELAGDSYSEAADYCKKRVSETGRVYIHPFDNPLVIAGQGTVGREIIEQLADTTHIFVPVGGGGLISGIAAYVKSVRPDIKIVSVEPEDSNAMQLSVKHHKRIVMQHVGIFADGVAVKQVGDNTFQYALKYVDDYITVSTDQICSAIKDVFEDTRSILEPAGALAVAGIKTYKLPKDAHVVGICSGANVTFERLQQIAERTLIGSGKEAMFAIKIPERPGALRRFCEEVVKGHSISEFNYRLNSRDGAHILVGIMIRGESDKRKFVQKMIEYKYEHEDLSNNDVTKSHVRHMIGGTSHNAKHEHIYEVNFPERPGALAHFLQTIGNECNISLFHYKDMASDISSVLIGFEVEDKKYLEQKLTKSNFIFHSVDKNKGVGLFLR
jgi:threonine dehydratase